MVKDIQSERPPGRKSRWATGLFATVWIGLFGVIGFVAAACGDDDDDYSTPTNYDADWHVITLQTPQGESIECVVSDYREGVWCK